jgi:hypothetical protein
LNLKFVESFKLKPLIFFMKYNLKKYNDQYNMKRKIVAKYLFS